jgi:DnaJ domain
MCGVSARALEPMTTLFRSLIICWTLIGASSAFCQDPTPSTPSSAEFTVEESALLLKRLTSDLTVLERLSEDRKAQLVASQNFRQAIIKRLEQLLTDRGASEIINLKKTVTTFYPEGSDFRKQFDALIEFGEKLDHYLATENTKALRALVEDDALSLRERRILEKQFINFVHTRVSELISAGDLTQALAKISEIPARIRDAETWGLLSRFLSELVRKPQPVPIEQMLTPESKEALLALGEKDPGALETLKRLYSLGLIRCAQKGDLALTKATLSVLETLKFEDSDLIATFLLEARGTVRHELAPGMFAELKKRRSPSLGLKWQLVIAGYYGPVVPVLIGLTFAFPTAAIALYILARVHRYRGTQREVAPKPKRRDKKLPGYMTPIEVEDDDTVLEDEYSRLLRMFGLRDSASESDIKQAYRHKMKQLHPDKKPEEVESQDENSEQFRELKHAYDRILEIRGSWFRGRRS